MTLEARLRKTVRGRVDFGAGARGLYSMDASNYRRAPIGVVTPETVDDVRAAVAAAREFGVPLVPRGGGTSIGGNSIGGLVIDFSRHLNRIIDVDPERRLASVEPGVVLDHLRAAAAPFGLTFGPDPSTHSRATLGGMIGNNACGSHSLTWGRTVDHVRTLDVLLSDGHRMTVGRTTSAAGSGVALPARTADLRRSLLDLTNRHESSIRSELDRFPRQVSGYGLHHLLPEN